MATLREIQHDFADALLDPARSIPCHVTSHTAGYPAARFNVYRNNVLASLIDVLASYFPVVRRLVGDEFFRAMAGEHVRQHPPRSPMLSRYGEQFPAFIASFDPVQDLPYLGDIARLEWHVLRAYHAADRRPLTASEIARSTSAEPQSVVLALHPSAALLASAHPIVSIWETNTNDDMVRPVDLASGGEHALVLRRELEVVVFRIGEGAHALLLAMRSGQTLGESIRAAATTEQRIAASSASLQAMLASLIGAGAFVDCRVQERSNRQIGKDDK